MNFQASGFSLDLPPHAVDSSSYVFVFPDQGDFPPNICIRFQPGAEIDMPEQMVKVRSAMLENLPDALIEGEDKVMNRGDWKYFTHVIEFGEPTNRMRQKEIHLLVQQPKPTYYVISGVDLADNFVNFEATYDNLVRSFQPNELQRFG